MKKGDIVLVNSNSQLKVLTRGNTYEVTNFDGRHYFGWNDYAAAIQLKDQRRWFRTSNFTIATSKEIDELANPKKVVVIKVGTNNLERYESMSAARAYVSRELKSNPLSEFAVYELAMVGKTKEIPVDWDDFRSPASA